MSTTPERRGTREWVLLTTVVVLLAVTCVGLGRWQWHRYVSRSAEITTIDTNYSAAPVALDDVLGPGGSLPQDDVWRQVRLTGHYLPGGTVLLRNRPVSSQPGFHVLAPFVDDASGTILVVDRGFLNGLQAPNPADVPQPPAGTVTVVVHLRADEPASARGAIPDQVHAINTAQVLAAGSAEGDAADARTVAAYGALASETPVGPDAPQVLPPPDTDPGNHLSYAFQWWVFAVGLLVMLGVLAQRDRQSRRVSIDDILVSSGEGTSVRVGAGAEAAAQRRAKKRRETDEDALEDELIESQIRR